MNQETIFNLKKLGVDTKNNLVEIKDFTGKIRNIKIEDKEITKGILNELTNSTISFQKSGKEIKEKLTIVLTDSQKEKFEYQSILLSLLSKISQIPTELPNEWLCSNLSKTISLPKLYNNKYLYDSFESTTALRNPILTLQQPELTEGEKIIAKEYNLYVEKYINCIKEISFIETFLKNLIDSKKYDLSIQQATAFGFNS